MRSSTEREDLFRDYVKKLSQDDEQERIKAEQEAKIRDRRAREEASLREREEQVRRERAQQRREMLSNRNLLVREDAITTMKALLIDIVRDPDVSVRSIILFVRKCGNRIYENYRCALETRCMIYKEIPGLVNVLV